MVGHCQEFIKPNNQLYNNIFRSFNIIFEIRQNKKYFNNLQSKERYHWANLLFKLANSDPVDLLMDVWVEILKKLSIGKEELVVISINIKKD